MTRSILIGKHAARDIVARGTLKQQFDQLAGVRLIDIGGGWVVRCPEVIPHRIQIMQHRRHLRGGVAGASCKGAAAHRHRSHTARLGVGTRSLQR